LAYPVIFKVQRENKLAKLAAPIAIGGVDASVSNTDRKLCRFVPIAIGTGAKYIRVLPRNVFIPHYTPGELVTNNNPFFLFTV
jgi:hypothetical protein